ncbi:hypothetical protein [Streptomyces sp. NPDC053367]|uniref:hypothetical protein n=1 Tax=Streptomyces sp. NPDC053367 TaxID=3365700 RepID=UPI0037CE1160
MPAEGHTHAEDELCEPGRELYARALRERSVSGVEFDTAPCLLELGLPQATVADPDRFEPLSSAFALHRLLRASEDRVAEEWRHLATTFDRLWRLATPMYPEAVQRPTLNGVTPRRRAIAALLIEGHTDAVIAERLGMNVRTTRVHIAKLAATLGSESRAQLGYLMGESGILKQEGGAQT